MVRGSKSSRGCLTAQSAPVFTRLSTLVPTQVVTGEAVATPGDRPLLGRGGEVIESCGEGREVAVEHWVDGEETVYRVRVLDMRGRLNSEVVEGEPMIWKQGKRV